MWIRIKGDDKLMEKKNRSRTSQVKRLEEALKEEREKSNEYLNRLKYLQADFENYRKRMEKEILETAHVSNEKLIVNRRAGIGPPLRKRNRK
jgi:molecular chaperone GrpE